MRGGQVQFGCFSSPLVALSASYWTPLKTGDQLVFVYHNVLRRTIRKLWFVHVHEKVVSH